MKRDKAYLKHVLETYLQHREICRGFNQRRIFKECGETVRSLKRA
jgi:hypothetical protein